MSEKYLNNRFFTLYFLPLIIGSLTVFSFQPFNLTIINFFILPIFFYLIIYINKKSKSTYRKKPFRKNLFIFGTSFGFGYFFSGLHWITNSLTFDQSFQVFIPITIVLMPLFLSLFFSLVTLLIGPFLSLNFQSILLLSGALSFSDYIRSKILSGFPWNLWTYSFSWATELLQILNIIGLFALNLVYLTIFILPAILFFNISFNKKFIGISIIPIIIFVSYIYGDHSINQNKKSLNLVEKKIYVKVVSPNFEIDYGLSKKEIEKRLKNIIRYSQPKKNLPTLFVWPEGVFSGYSFKEVLIFRNIFSKNFSNKHLILFGVNKIDEKTGKFFNSLLIVNNNLKIIDEYKKQKLVPFGEFLPFEKFLKRFGLKKITEGHASFLKGENQENLIKGNLNILPLICYEIIFTELIQQSNINTNLIVNISEDGWFGKSIGPHQHFAKAIFRAIEQDTFLIRSANKGITAIINNKGEIVKEMKINEVGSINLDVPLINSDKKNKNDLIFFILLFTYILIFKFYKKKIHV